MVGAVRSGRSLREAAFAFGFTKSTAERWVKRVEGVRLDRADFEDHKSGRAWNRTTSALERRIVAVRQELKQSVLGESGAQAIARVLQQRKMRQPPSVATINRVLSRLGLQDGTRRIRQAAPPKGWYIPSVALGRAELDCFDFVEALKIANGPVVDLLTAKGMHDALTDAWVLQRSAKNTIPCLLERWKRDGLPAYAQFDNDMVFAGAHQLAHAVGLVSRLCLQLKVIPVFVPPREHGMQNTIEGFNGLWQAKVWQRFRVSGLAELRLRSAQYIAAHRARNGMASESAPPRTLIPKNFKFAPQAPFGGQMIFIRRTDELGRVQMLGQRFFVSRQWLHRLVRCEVDLDRHRIRCFALRRRAPGEQPLLTTIPYRRPNTPFEGRYWVSRER